MHPNLSKEKLYPFVKRFCESKQLSCPRARTIGRIIADAPDKMRSRPMKLRPNGQRIERKKTRKRRKPKGYKASGPGECGAFDTVEYFLDGMRRYVITFTDHYSRFAFAWATQSHASLAAREFFSIVTEVFPYPLKSVLTDNDCEFMKHFDEEIHRLHKNHWHTYPKTPKMNAHVERFNRTIQEEFIDYHEELLITPISSIGN
jgi:transposase InsO family protein